MTDRKTFVWTDEDRAKLVPGAKVTRYFTDGMSERVTIVWAGGFVKFTDEHGGLYDSSICTFDPATIEPPRREESGLVEALRKLANELFEQHLYMQQTGVVTRFSRADASDLIQELLKEHGHG